jgi:mannose-6-phosphate isomerase-like protein (cupin superfamily)
MNKRLSRYHSIKEYITKDGSAIRELMHPGVHGNEGLSLAEARISAGETTCEHYHNNSEEIYLVMAGTGLMKRADERIVVEKGDCLAIMPGEVHSLKNNGDTDLVVLCCCTPAYGHDDTILVGETNA